MSLRKTRPADRPYETWSAPGGWSWKVRKFYKSRENTIADPYGRVLCDVKSPHTMGGVDTGDVYYREIRTQAQLVWSDYGE
jgi:hypothetical protein